MKNIKLLLMCLLSIMTFGVNAQMLSKGVTKVLADAKRELQAHPDPKPEEEAAKLRALLEKLDALFALPPVYRVHGYGGEIHEMTEMAAADLGQFAISNQPSFHLPFLYAALGHPEKAAYWAHKAALENFSDEPDGFPGDEDNGTTAAWFIFVCLGEYPLCPGKPENVKFPGLAKSFKIN